MTESTSVTLASRLGGRRVVEQAVVALLAFAIFFTVARWRIADDDEGYYAIAGRAMLDGRVPYRDFFFPQMPLASLIYGVWQEAFSYGLRSLRTLAAAAGAITACLVYHGARRREGPWAGAFATALLVAHVLVWEWVPTVKTHPLAVLFTLGAIVVATGGRPGERRAAGAGLVLGLAAMSRLLAAPAIVGVTLACAVRAPSNRRLHAAGAALAGFGVALIPMSVLAALDPGAVWFDNVTFHVLRGSTGGSDAFVQRLDVVRAVFLSPLGATRPDPTGLQTSALLVTATAFAWKTRDDGIFFVALSWILIVAAFVPSPTWSQYFVLAIAPCAVVAGRALARCRHRWLGILAVTAYALVATPAVFDRLIAQPPLYRVGHYDAVARRLDAHTIPGEAVAAHWPNYLAASRRRILPEAENQFARLFSDRLSASERRRYHLHAEDDFKRALLRREAHAFVVGTYTVPETALALKDAGWRRGDTLPGATIWTAPR